MKIRTGFVSNSSTSTFIMVGFVINKDAPLCEREAKEITKERLIRTHPRWKEISKSLEDYMDSNDIALEEAIDSISDVYGDDDNIDFLDNEEDGAPENSMIVGIKLAEYASDSAYICEFQCSQDELLAHVEKIRSRLNIPSHLNWTIYLGTRMS